MGQFPAIEAALRGPIAEEIVAYWTMLASGISATGAYIRGLHAAESIVTEPDGNPYAVIVQNVDPHAIFVDEGHEGFHLPERIQKWHLTKRGRRVVVVPFRHFTEMGPESGPSGRARRAAMPEAIHQMAKAGPVTGLGNLYKQSKSYVYYRARGWPNVPAGETHRVGPQALLRVGYTWKASPFEGLRRYGASGHSHYLTFRTITPESEGWYIPAVEGHHFPEQVVAGIGGRVAEILGEAAAEDLVEHFTATMTAAGATTVVRTA